MSRKTVLFSFILLAVVRGQQVGTMTVETHPTLTWQKCTTSGGCATQSTSSITLDSNWRWTHLTTGISNCYTGNTWDSSICPDGVTCAANCALDGADYSGTYGISTSGSSVTLKFITTSTQRNVGSRVYLMANDSAYQMFKPLNQEFSFDVDVSNLPCGINGALYFSQMDADGGMAKYPTNKAGAKYGTGYCDSQCPRDLKFINGVANVMNWTATSTNAGTGSFGSCCNEMDIWEANSISSAFTPHPCSVVGQTKCTGITCGGDYGRYAGVCDPDGCDFNPYRMGNTTFYGNGKTVDTSSKLTVVTQFITDTGTASGTLVEIRRLYVQKGKVIQNSYANVAGVPTTDNSITDAFCSAQKTAFGDTQSFEEKGSLAGMSAGLASGVVLVMSIWDDPVTNMDWLDSAWPATAATTTPGVLRGTCAPGTLATTEDIGATASVVFSNIKFGDIGSTYLLNGTTTTTSGGTSTTSTTTTSAAAATQTKYGQCGGTGWTGATVCVSGTTCIYSNAFWSQCL